MDINLPLEFVAGLVGIQAGELSDAIKKDDEELKSPEEIQGFLTDSFKRKLVDTKKAARDEGYGRGKKESLTAVEKELSEEWGIDAGTVPDMAKAYVEKQLAGTKAKKTELTPEAIKNHEVYVSDMKAEIAKRTALEDEFKQFKGDAEYKEVLHSVGSRAKALLEKHKFALPDNPNIRQNALSGFMQSIQDGVRFKVDGEKTILHDPDGNPIRNDLMNEVSFEDHVVDKAKGWFEIVKDDGRDSPGAHTQAPNGQAPSGGFPAVTSSAEFFTELSKIEKLEDKKAFKEHYEKQLASGFN